MKKAFCFIDIDSFLSYNSLTQENKLREVYSNNG